MIPFRCIPISALAADRFRRTGLDDCGNTLRRTSAAGSGSPCCQCLCCATKGEEMLLGSYDLPAPLGIYWTPSPIFVHARPCTPYVSANTVAPIIAANPLVSVRAYYEADQCLYDLGQVCEGNAVAGPLQRALADTRTAFVNVHTARPGCLLCRVERA